jgi:glucosamine-6-phosphate deaminase
MISNLSFVEKKFLDVSKKDFICNGENIPIIEVENKNQLGKLVALRFLEWVLKNPKGMVGLPTGKTPEHFIKQLNIYKTSWNESKIQEELKQFGIESENFPDTSNLKFVQIDEFFPVDFTQKNSFFHYVKTYYLSVLGIKEENVLMMDDFSSLSYKELKNLFPEDKADLSLLERNPENELEKKQKEVLCEVEKNCKKYEERIQQFGGIGFLLGGIGPDGHIAFNMKGSSFQSVTRLVKLNYESAVAAAKDWGGVEFSRDKTAISIGLKTITSKSDATIIIMASGVAKAFVVAKAIEGEKSEEIPSSILHGNVNARFYLTTDASEKLLSRRVKALSAIENLEELTDSVDEIIYEVALESKKTVAQLNKSDFKKSQVGSVLLGKIKKDILEVTAKAQRRLIDKMESGFLSPKNLKIMHTAPHPDDIMLSYCSYTDDLISKNDNFFVYLTNGFHAVSNSYIQDILKSIDQNFLNKNKQDILLASYEEILEKFLDAYKNSNLGKMEKIEKSLFLRLVVSVFELSNLEDLALKLKWLEKEYLPKQYPGQHDLEIIKKLKGKIRESEVDRLWAIKKVSNDNIFHLDSKFYDSDSFAKNKNFDLDIKTVTKLIEKLNPHVITVAIDPPGRAPDTHHKVLQIIRSAASKTKSNLNLSAIWGYRNVWKPFKPSMVNAIIPVSKQELLQLNKIFHYCFSTQVCASFPSPKFDGPFSELSCNIKRDQLSMIKKLLGEKFFKNHSDFRLRNAEGLVFLQKMNIGKFLKNN